MAGVVQLTIAIDENAADVAADLITSTQPDPAAFLRILSRKVAACAGGVRGAKFTARVDDMDPDGMDSVSITNTIVKASLVADTDTLTIGLVTFEWVASGTTDTDVVIGTDSATCATNLAAKINAHPVLAGLFSATAASGVCTITYHGDPRLGTFVLVSEAGAGQTLSAVYFGSTESDAATTESDVITGSLGL